MCYTYKPGKADMQKIQAKQLKEAQEQLSKYPTEYVNKVKGIFKRCLNLVENSDEEAEILQKMWYSLEILDRGNKEPHNSLEKSLVKYLPKGDDNASVTIREEYDKHLLLLTPEWGYCDFEEVIENLKIFYNLEEL